MPSPLLILRMRVLRMLPASLRPGRLFMLFRRLLKNDQLIQGGLGIFVGLMVGGGIVLFREIVGIFQHLFYSYNGEFLVTHIGRLPWWYVLAMPAIGGLFVGYFYHKWMPGNHPQAVGHVIKAVATTHSRMPLKSGFFAAIGSALSIGAGAAVGREGPAVHLGATLSSFLAEKLRFRRSMTRTLLGCGAAAAVAASFNAPLAGALFAHEVVVGHYALSAFAPVVLSSISATVVSRLWFGDFPSFFLPKLDTLALWELPWTAFLGVFCAIAAVLLLQVIFRLENLFQKSRLQPMYYPMIAGLCLGLGALVVPDILGIGYEVTDMALKGQMAMGTLLLVFLARLIGAGLSLGAGFGGGIFSPALAIGAPLGGLYGHILCLYFDGCAGSGTYALIGMGGVAAAVMGAPISTVLIAFELTANYPVAIGVMACAVIASVLMQLISGHKSFFHADLKRRGVDISESSEIGLLRAIRVRDVMALDFDAVPGDTGLQEVREALQNTAAGELFVQHSDGHLMGTITLADLHEAAFDHDYDHLLTAESVARTHPPFLLPDDTLEHAVKLMLEELEEHVAVVENADSMKLVGCVHETELLLAYNRALMVARAEERGDSAMVSPF